MYTNLTQKYILFFIAVICDLATILQSIIYTKKIPSILECVKKMWKGHCLKEQLRAILLLIISRSESFNRVQTVIANYKFSEKIKYLKP